MCTSACVAYWHEVEIWFIAVSLKLCTKRLMAHEKDGHIFPQRPLMAPLCRAYV